MHGKPNIFNTDQGCRFTSLEFTGLLKDNGTQVSMDGKDSWRDNVFVERLWKSVKYEEVYLHAYDSVCDAKQGLEKYFVFYNQNRPYTAFDDKTPNEFYFNNLPAMQKTVQSSEATSTADHPQREKYTVLKTRILDIPD
ncbi:integrase-like protein [Nitrosomonas sp. Nm84]|nr:integrase-like protein [Nitrosomonas sp. Nm84]